MAPGETPAGNWENRLRDLFADLEQQAEGLHLSERDAEVSDRSRSEYSRVTMASRLHASMHRTCTMRLLGAGRLEGTLIRIGLNWCLVRAAPSGVEWIIRLDAILDIGGLSDRAVSEPARSVLGRLGLGSALRGVAESGAAVVFEHVDGTRQRGVIVRVGADFAEVRDASALGGGYVLPFAAMAAVRKV